MGGRACKSRFHVDCRPLVELFSPGENGGRLHFSQRREDLINRHLLYFENF